MENDHDDEENNNDGDNQLHDDKDASLSMIMSWWSTLR